MTPAPIVAPTTGLIPAAIIILLIAKVRLHPACLTAAPIKLRLIALPTNDDTAPANTPNTKSFANRIRILKASNDIPNFA